MGKLINFSEYNYDSFKPLTYVPREFGGPRAGERFLNFSAYTLEKKRVRLSDFLHKPIVLETGSLTCPMYSQNTSAMQQLMEQFPEVQFVLLYVREAHPGSETSFHHSLDEKIRLAKRLRKEDQENRLILVDNIRGSAHRLYGGFPNMSYILDSSGTVIFRADWNHPKMIGEVLEGMKGTENHHVYFQDHFKAETPNPFLMTRVLLKGGWDALWDMIIGWPKFKSRKKSKSISSYDQKAA